MESPIKAPLTWLPVVALATSLESSPDPALQRLQPFLEQYCVQCHGPEKQKNDIRLDTLGTDLSDHATLETWQGILDQLNLGEMPPEEKPQPGKETLENVVTTITPRLLDAYAKLKSTGARAVIRRLNRGELRNTLRDLLYLQGAAYKPGEAAKLVDNNGNGKVERKGSDPVRQFPEDEEEQGFTNIGDRLVMSDFLLKLIIGAAEESLAAATHSEPEPDTTPRTFSGHLVTGKQYGQQAIETVSREYNPGFDLLTQGYQRYGRLSPDGLRGGVKTAANYRITIEASAHNPESPWPELVKLNPGSPFQLSLNIADTQNGGISGPTSTMIKAWDIPPDGKKRSFTFESWVDATWTPWVGWENGPYNRAFRAETILQKYYPGKFFPRPDKKEDKVAHEEWPVEMARLLTKDGYAGSHIRVYRITLEPLIHEWPPKSHTALYGDGQQDKETITTLLQEFASRAYREPVAKKEVRRYVDLVQSLLGDTKPKFKGGLQDLGFKAYKGKWTNLPDFEKLEPAKEGVLPGGLVDINAPGWQEYYSILFTGTILAQVDGTYEFEIASDDGCRLLVDGNAVVGHDGLHGAERRTGKVQLREGRHKIRIEYLAYGQPNNLQVAWKGPGFSMSPLSASVQMATADPLEGKFIQAMQAGYTAILCSPRFLYLRESEGSPNPYETASRLSYFLWSSMPDNRLFSLAKEGKLRDKEVLRQEVERMLGDPKARAFEHNFTMAWLRLDKLGKMPPERGGPFRFYHDRRMEPMFMDQAVAYVADVLARNLPVHEFIDSDYTYMNHAIAQWTYQRDDINGDSLKRVKLDDPRRGGILTMPGVMTATANGVDTTPVVRGVWFLENILGTPPSPPPPDVEPLSPDLRGAKTIREQLELHRKSEACNGCHRKIDPLGFPFENFNPVGQWRDQYPTKPRLAIDPSTTLPDGKAIENIVGFKKSLLAREDEIARCLVKKMLTYATGRMMEPVDRGEIDRITRELGKGGYRFRDLVHLVATSPVFLGE